MTNETQTTAAPVAAPALAGTLPQDHQPMVAPVTSAPGGFSLSLPPVAEIAREVVTVEPAGPVEDPQLAAMADQFVTQVMSNAAGMTDADRQRNAIDSMGIEIQQQAARRSEMLKTPIRQLAHTGDEGGPVAKALIDLRGQMEQLDPSGVDFSTGGLAKLLSWIPGVGNKLQRYFHKFETAQEAIDEIIKDLKGGADMLRRDNVTLGDDQKALRELLNQLSRQIDLGRMIDSRLVDQAAALPAEAPQRRFVEEELVFPLRQRVVDLQQQLAVSQQGVIALEVVIRNNRELIRGVDRAVNVTVSALNVAVTTALALSNQKLVLDRIESLNTTTSTMIAGTAKALRTQGVDIQKRASSSMLDMKQLESAFSDVLGALDEVSRYRREALPKLDEQIDRLEGLAKQGSESIRRMEEGNAAQPMLASMQDDQARKG